MNNSQSGFVKELSLSGVNSPDGSMESSPQILLKALPLKSKDEMDQIKQDVKSRTIVILKITPLAQKSLEDLKTTIEELTEFTTSFGGDIARLGEERIVITPPGVRIWRGEKASQPAEGNRVSVS
ncbi:MAG TPA: cell division protein SepF [Nitrososphaerales archaeon]|nr:cell division protein SepF [Nitrososphaerales archaeon]